MSSLNDNHDAEIISVAVIFQTLMTLSFTIRLISVRLRGRRYALDDFLLAIAFVAASIEAISYATGTRVAGIGHRAKSLTSNQLIVFEKMFFASGYTQPTALAFAKLSLIILLHRIFAVNRFRIVTWVLAIIVILWWLASILVGTVNCLPIESLWNPAIPGHCGDQFKIQISEPIPWILTDFAVLIAPLPMIKRLQLPWNQKTGLTGLFLLGGVTCVASCVRFSTVWYSAEDVTYDIHSAACWSIIESTLGIIVVSLIVSRPILSRFVPKSVENYARAVWTKLTRSLSPVTSGGNFFSFRRLPKDAPMLPTVKESTFKMDSVDETGQKDVDLESMNTRGHLEQYHAKP